MRRLTVPQIAVTPEFRRGGRPPRVLWLGLAACLLSTACNAPRFTTTILNPLNLKLPFLPYEKPVRIGLADRDTGIFDPATWDVAQVGSPWTPLRTQLQRHLDRPVQISELEPFQMAAHLQSGRIDFALVPAVDYVAMTREFGDCGKVIALSHVNERQGLIVVRAGSSLQSLADLKGKRFAFGPSGDPVLDLGAKEALKAGGVNPEELQKELVPVPGAFQHHISANESAYEIVYGLGTEAGVIEKSDYDGYPDQGGSLLLRRFAKGNFRVLGETAPYRMETIPDGPVVAAADTDSQLVERVTDFLLAAEKKNRDAMLALGLHCFEAPPADLAAQLERLAAVEGVPSGPVEPPDEAGESASTAPTSPDPATSAPVRSSPGQPLPMTPVPR